MNYDSIILVTAIVWLFLAIHVSSEARKEGRSSLFWFLFTLIFGIIALLLWAGRANKGYKQDNSKSNTGGNSFQIKTVDVYVMRGIFTVIVLGGLFCVLTGILAGPEIEYVKVCDGVSIYADCHMEKQKENTGGFRTLSGVILLLISVPFGIYERILKSKAKKNKANQLNH